NDFIQGIIMLFGIVAVIAAVLNDNGGLALAMEKLATGPTGGWQYASFLGANPLFLLFVVILTSLGTWGLPQMVGKFYAIKNESSIQKGTVISTLFAIVVAGGCYFLGGFGRLYDIDVKAEGFDAVIPRMLSSLPAVIIGVVIVLVLSASMSTLSSLVLTSASTMTLDLIAPKRKKPFREKDQLLLMRGFIVLFIVISALIAIKQAHSKSLFIAQMMGVSWGALAGAFLAPFLYGLYSKRTTKLSVVVCFAWGVGLETVQLLVSLGLLNVSGSPLFAFVFNNSIYSGVIAMVGGLVLVPLVDLFSQKLRPVHVEDMFSAYREHRTVDITDNLGK
ncbi:MAG: sodium:solute symporter, partial [Bacteroidales bacterium]|nr:sodium:solute symporter [Bacteroidales bacterium]